MPVKIALIDLCIQKFPDLPKNEIYARIIRGQVYVNGEKKEKPGQLIGADSIIEISIQKNYFSRGALKLGPVLKDLKLPIRDLHFIDAGASTGGFTRSLLELGAVRVYAVDVGYNQLAYSLRADRRVVVWERKNIMDVQPVDFESQPFGAVCDLSFRSISGAAEHIISLCNPEGWLLALIKPQFEWRNPGPEFKGVVNDKNIIREILLGVNKELASRVIKLVDVVKSPQKGAKGNQEYFFLLKKGYLEIEESECLINRLF